VYACMQFTCQLTNGGILLCPFPASFSSIPMKGIKKEHVLWILADSG